MDNNEDRANFMNNEEGLYMMCIDWMEYTNGTEEEFVESHSDIIDEAHKAWLATEPRN